MSRPLKTIAALSITVLAACTSAPPTSAPPEASASPTHPLFGSPPPVDPCQLLSRDEIATVLGRSAAQREQETSGGAAYSCTFELPSMESRISVTVSKAPVTDAAFEQVRISFGARATVVEDLGTPAFSVVFGPTASVYALRSGLELYIDLARDGFTGGEVLGQALALMERALSRVSTGAGPSIGPSRVSPSG